MDKFFPHRTNSLYGIPVKRIFLKYLDDKRENGFAHFKIGFRQEDYSGIRGSLGARTLNQASLERHEAARHSGLNQVLWQCG